MKRLLLATTLVVPVLTHSAFADILHTDDVIISSGSSAGSRLCVGADCADGETFPSATFDGVIKMSANNNVIDFNDTSGIANPDRNWRIQANETTGAGAGEAFFIQDLTASTKPFYIKGSAPSNSLFVASDGNIGLGTTLPAQKLHIIDTHTPTIRLERASAPTHSWEISANHGNFYLRDETANTFPFVVDTTAPDHSISVDTSGMVGLGTGTPEGKLHTKGDGVQLAYFESGNGGPVQVRFRTDSENRRFLAVNNANEVKSQIIFLDDHMKLTGPTDTGTDIWLQVGPGGIVTGPPACDDENPCDRTFDPEFFTVPPISERAAYMWENMHLPAVGPTSSDQPINLTEKTGGIIHELEVAHIYIEQLHEKQRTDSNRIETQSKMIAQLRQAHDAQISNEALFTAQIAALTERLNALEALK